MFVKQNLRIWNYQVGRLSDSGLPFHFLHLSNYNRGNQGNRFFQSKVLEVEVLVMISREENENAWQVTKCCQHLTWTYTLKTPSLLLNKPSKHVVLTCFVFVPPVVSHSETLLENNPSIALVSLLGEATNLESQKHVHVTVTKKLQNQNSLPLMYDLFVLHTIWAQLPCHDMEIHGLVWVLKASPRDPWNFEDLGRVTLPDGHQVENSTCTNWKWNRCQCSNWNAATSFRCRFHDIHAIFMMVCNPRGFNPFEKSLYQS